MKTTAEKKVKWFPLKKILGDIAKRKGLHLRDFNEKYFIPQEHGNGYPLLQRLYSRGLAPISDSPSYTFFEGMSPEVSIGYFGREVERFSKLVKESGIVEVEGRVIIIALNETGKGKIEIEDERITTARMFLGNDSFGSDFDRHPKGRFGFYHSPSNTDLSGVKGFLEVMTRINHI